MTKLEYEKIVNDLKKKLNNGWQLSNKEDGYNQGILCAISKVREVYQLNEKIDPNR